MGHFIVTYMTIKSDPEIFYFTKASNFRRSCLIFDQVYVQSFAARDTVPFS